MEVLANAETVAEVELALHFGAEGIGLCRTEHMFLNAERLGDVQRMILAETGTGAGSGAARSWNRWCRRSSCGCWWCCKASR